MSKPEIEEIVDGTTDVFGARVGAQLVDTVLLACVHFGIALFLAAYGVGKMGSLFRSLFIAAPLYGGLTEHFWEGQTPGKVLFNIAVVDEYGRTPSLARTLFRNLPAVILWGWPVTTVGALMISVSDDDQRFFDDLAGTYVVST